MSMLQDEKIRKLALRACKEFERTYKFRCPVCKSMATAQKHNGIGMIAVQCPGCERVMGWKL